tara:strand:+ start:1412 stop:2269 length:858 start_codon:yes stop_codon:yes gene_type:complete
MVKKKIFIFGAGQVAKYFVNNNVKNKFYLTSTKKTYNKRIGKRNIKVFYFKNNSFDKRIKKILKNCEYIIVSVPPNNFGDITLKVFQLELTKAKFKKLVYLSSTSVYGNHKGSWVNEKSKLKSTTLIGKKRILAETQWKKFRKNFNRDVSILRIAGIYSKESNILKKIIKSPKYVKEKKFFSRIRIEDLTQIIKRLLRNKKQNMILNIADDKPSTNVEVAKYAANLLGIKKIEAVPISAFKNKMIKNFYKDSKKVSNTLMKRQLKIRLKYPNYRIGIKNLMNKII